MVSMTLRHTGGLPYTQEGFSQPEHQSLIQRLQEDGLQWAPPPRDPDTPEKLVPWFLYRIKRSPGREAYGENETWSLQSQPWLGARNDRTVVASHLCPAQPRLNSLALTGLHL